MEAASSAINAVHPDDEVEGFFGGDGEAAEPGHVDLDPDLPVGDTVTQPAEAPAPPAEEKVTPEPEPEPAKERGTAAREYVVFQEVPLTEKTLKHLLAQVESGDAPKPRIALFELERVSARNVNGAVVKAYNEHKAVLGDKADMAVVSSKSFAKRHVEPKQRVETALSVS